MALINIAAGRIVDWDSFHDVFAEALHFPGYYGRNGNAFIDCLGDIASGRDVPPLLVPGERLIIDLGHVATLRDRCPDQLAGLMDWTGWVNAQQIDVGSTPPIALAFRG